MRKEGTVRTRAALSTPLIPRPSRRLVNGLASRPILGPSSKVSIKPKSTGKSNRHNFIKLLKTGENMKREDGRQRGVVRTRPLVSGPLMPRPHRRLVSELASRPTGVLFSKHTGKCNRSHIRPASRSKPKVKGAHNKVKSLSDIRLVSWRVVDAPCSKLSGSSATRVLDYLDSRGFSHSLDDDLKVD